ncbi:MULTISPECIES: hypothetical protein [Bacteroides]|uniref:hypothetical protein n=1 Tax=Bacteroides TaxID=816 RepID=UPI00259BF131|nr:hypothetical protein [Bacteroides acidifaciens]
MKQTDKRVGIIDQYYMRIYDAYFKKKDPARFAACLYIGLTIGLLLSPIPIFCAELFHTDERNVDAIILRLYAISILIWAFGTFNEKRIQKLKAMKAGQHSKYSVPTWCLFLMLPVGFIWAVLLDWLMLHYVIHPYQLEGIFVK